MRLRMMGLNSIRSLQFKLRLSYEGAFALLLGLVWTEHTLFSYFKAILVRIPYVYEVREHIITFIFAMVTVLALPYMLKRIHPGLILSYLGICIVYFLNFMIYPENTEALEQNLIPFLIEAFPMVFVGVSVDLKKHYRMLYHLSLLSVIARFIQLLLDPQNLAYGDMYSSYLLLPHVCLVIATAFSDTNILNVIVSIIGAISILAFGTRGPLLCLLVLVLLYVLVFVRLQKHIWMICLLGIFSILGVAFFYEEIILFLLSLVQRLGMSTRVIDMGLAGDILESSGRNMIQSKLLVAVSDNLFGYGIAGDRTIVGTYAHNILIEFWVSYGIFVGTALFVIPMHRMVKLLRQKRRYNFIEDRLIIALISSTLMRLFMSGSYLTESFLFLLVGIIIVEYKKMNMLPLMAMD